MDPGRKPRTLKRIPLRLALIRVAPISLAIAVLALGGLSLQLASGNDPALAPKRASTHSKDSSNSPLRAVSSVPVAPQSQPVAVTPTPVQTSTS